VTGLVAVPQTPRGLSASLDMISRRPRFLAYGARTVATGGSGHGGGLLAYWWPGNFLSWRPRVATRNIDIVLGGLADAMRSRDPERIAEFLGPDLVWEGVEPGLRCDGRQQAMSVIRNRFAAAPFTVQAVEAIEAGQHVIVGLRGPGFNGTPGDLETVGQIFNVFTLSDGKVVRWRDFLTRREALAAANAEDRPWQ
jgi:limonene-1,2-epoxide hydrolase